MWHLGPDATPPCDVPAPGGCLQSSSERIEFLHSIKSTVERIFLDFYGDDSCSGRFH